MSKWVETREPTRPTMGSGQVRLKFFYKFQYGLIFDPTHLEFDLPDWICGEPGWLTNSQIKGYISIFYYIGLCIWVGLDFFFNQHNGNLYFCDFGLYLEFNILLDCIWILLKFIYILIIIIIYFFWDERKKIVFF